MRPCAFIAPTMCAVLVLSASVRIASAGTQPALIAERETWKSSGGECTLDVSSARVGGVPDGTRDRIDGLLDALLADSVPSTSEPPSQREAECAKAISGMSAHSKAFGGRYYDFEVANWTTGLAHGRWLSVRLHHARSVAGEVHPHDDYSAMTFDLRNGGNPVRPNGFYSNAQTPRFKKALLQAEVAQLKSADPHNPPTEATIDYLRVAMAVMTFDASHILLTPKGIEVTGIQDPDVAKDDFIEVPYSSLRGIGTPGGPLDPATRR